MPGLATQDQVREMGPFGEMTRSGFFQASFGLELVTILSCTRVMLFRFSAVLDSKDVG